MKWVLTAFVLGIILFLAGSFFLEPRSVEVEPKQTVEVKPQQVKVEQIRIILVGDVMLDRGVEYMVEKYGNGDFKFPFLKVADYLKEADVLFGNLEGVISDKGVNVGSIYSFRAESAAILGLTYAGFDILSLANNHAFDYGREALEDCLTTLSNEGIDYLGAGFTEKETYSPIIKEIRDTKIGFLAYTNLGPETWRAVGENPGIAWIDEFEFNQVKQEIEEVKEQVDVLIVSLHGGEEYSPEPDQFQIDFSKMAIEAGADLVVGHHPHLIQPNEKYKSGFIFYSLGNFIFDQSFSEETMKGQIIEITIENNIVKEVKPREVRINDFFQPNLTIDK